MLQIQIIEILGDAIPLNMFLRHSLIPEVFTHKKVLELVTVIEISFYSLFPFRVTNVMYANWIDTNFGHSVASPYVLSLHFCNLVL